MRLKVLGLVAAAMLIAAGPAVSQELHFYSKGQEYAYDMRSRAVYRYDTDEAEWKQQRTNVVFDRCLQRRNGCDVTEVYPDGESEYIGPITVMGGRLVSLDALLSAPPPFGGFQQGGGYPQWMPPPNGFPTGGYPTTGYPPPVGGPGFGTAAPTNGGKQTLGALPPCGGQFAMKGPQQVPKDPATGAPLCKLY